MRNVFWALALLLLAVVPSTALATNYSVRFCPQVDTDYEDSEAEDGDFWDNDDNRPARGFLVTVVEDDHSPPVDILYQDHVPSSGANMGCTSSLSLDSMKDYDVIVESEAEIGSNMIYSVDDGAGGQNPAITKVVDDFSPTQAGDVVGTPLDGATEPRWNHLALAAFAMFNENGGLSGVDILMDATLCDDGELVPTYFPCAYENAGIHLGSNKWKFLVAHEIGHTVSMKVDAGDELGCNSNCNADEDDCHGDDSTTAGSGHGTLTKEYQSCAGCEGVADFYSTLVWNSHGPDDNCQFSLWYLLDWNIDGDMNTDIGDPYACNGDPYSGGPVGAWDWLEDLVNADDSGGDSLQCDGTLTNRSTPYDWNRYFWEMVTVEDVPVSEIWDMWDYADPWDWRKLDTGPADLPTYRMDLGAFLTGNSVPHGNQDDHGLDH